MKIGVLFGAGAEIAYNMPSGMKFAANILFPDNDIANKSEENFDTYLGATAGFQKLTATDRKTILKSMVKHNKKKIQEFFEKLDEIETYKPLRDRYVDNDAANNEFNTDIPKTLKALTDFSEETEVISFILTLYVSVTAEIHVQDFNDKLSIFKSWLPDKDVAKTNFDVLPSLSEKLVKNLYDKKNEDNTTVKLAKELFEKSLNYEGLLTPYYDNLFSDKDFSSSSFRKIASLLFIAQEYVKKSFNAKPDETYYNDIKQDGKNDWTVATTNYSNVEDYLGFGEKTENPIFYLNGNVNKYLNLKTYDIIDENEAKKEKSCVPLLLLQTTVKPFLAFEFIEMFTDAYKNFKKCDVIGVIGFGFNEDDGVINSMFRKLLKDNKTVVYFKYAGERNKESKNNRDINSFPSQLKEFEKNLKIVPLFDDRKLQDGTTTWISYLEKCTEKQHQN